MNIQSQNHWLTQTNPRPHVYMATFAHDEDQHNIIGYKTQARSNPNMTTFMIPPGSVVEPSPWMPGTAPFIA